jgi:hypothetical protein
MCQERMSDIAKLLDYSTRLLNQHNDLITAEGLVFDSRHVNDIFTPVRLRAPSSLVTNKRRSLFPHEQCGRSVKLTTRLTQVNLCSVFNDAFQ